MKNHFLSLSPKLGSLSVALAVVELNVDKAGFGLTETLLPVSLQQGLKVYIERRQTAFAIHMWTNLTLFLEPCFSSFCFLTKKQDLPLKLLGLGGQHSMPFTGNDDLEDTLES